MPHRTRLLLFAAGENGSKSVSTSAPSAVPRSPSSTKLDARLSALAVALRPAGGTAVLEVFSGCARLSGALLEAGLRIAVPIDNSQGVHFDMTNPNIVG
eukprot:1425559-Heterocapsa_arctica.AAC.1